MRGPFALEMRGKLDGTMVRSQCDATIQDVSFTID
jgi:hypothetical protein